MTVASAGVTAGCDGVWIWGGVTCYHDIKNYTKYEFGYNFLLKSPFHYFHSTLKIHRWQDQYTEAK